MSYLCKVQLEEATSIDTHNTAKPFLSNKGYRVVGVKYSTVYLGCMAYRQKHELLRRH